ncbi:hypothetical protein N026_22725 [Pseudomonas syringae UB303]|uniref:Uncharacterized protein n=1 Tax=Pseudomonas syringae UB303 TaxID=1357287 RepID=A0AAJ4B1N4_PSESX|nr:hypothetical protein N026_22725 [Pseudomonas syringae UB303]
MSCWRTCASLSGSNREDAERPERHANAEHWHDSVLTDAYRSSRSSGLPPESWTVLARRLSPVFYGAQAV